jgi:putative chitinase
MILNPDRLRAALPSAQQAWLEELARAMPQWGFDTPEEAASFLAQIGHESNGLTVFEENLSYSAERLMQVWPHRFRSFEFAQRYERNPERLANYVYANRLGNGDEVSGDGWRFHGRGPIQLTGRNNYYLCGQGIGLDLIASPDLLLTPPVGVRAAIWFWDANNLDALDDDDDVRAETRKINGGETGLAYRQQLFNHCLRVLSAA